jgi:hypothetical protein
MPAEMRLFAAILLLALGTAPATAFEGKPKLGPDAVALTKATEYLRTKPAPDYWKLAQFYQPQETSSACSVASVAMAVNFVRGVPPGAEDPLVTQHGLLDAVADPAWAAKGAEGGDGVLFEELVDAVRKGLAAYGVEGAGVELFEPKDASPETRARLRAVLEANEASDRDVLLAYFNQGVLTGDWDGPHISPIGAFDAANGRVLVMDVDREWYVPYWSTDAKLLEAMLKPTSAEHGPLAGETGGLVWIQAPPRG